MATIKKRGIDDKGKEIWMIRVSIGGKQKGFAFHGTQKAAEKEAWRLENEKDQGKIVLQNKITVEEYLLEWLEVYQKTATGNHTFHDQKLKIIKYVIPTVGKKRLDVLKPMDCQKVINMIAVEQGKVRTAEITYNVMNKAFRKAVELGYITKNPMDAVTKPIAKSKPRPFLNIEQVVTLLNHAENDTYYAVFAFLALTGVRPEECFGLKWGDVNLDGGTASIVHSIKHIHGGGWERSDLKTPTSRRNLSLPQSLIGILKNFKRQQTKQRMIVGSQWNDNGLVFTNTVGNPVDIAVIRKRLAKFIDEINANTKKELSDTVKEEDLLPQIHLYDLRHSHGSMLMEQGAPIKEISDRLGHANTSMTVDRYLHTAPPLAKASVDRLDQAFNAVKQKQEEKGDIKDVN